MQEGLQIPEWMPSAYLTALSILSIALKIKSKFFKTCYEAF